MKKILTEQQLASLIEKCVIKSINEITDFEIGRNARKNGTKYRNSWVFNGDDEKTNDGARLDQYNNASQFDGYNSTDYDGNRISPDEAKEKSLGLERGIKGVGRRLAAKAGNSFEGGKKSIKYVADSMREFDDDIKRYHNYNKDRRHYDRQKKKFEKENPGKTWNGDVVDTDI